MCINGFDYDSVHSVALIVAFVFAIANKHLPEYSE